MNIRLCIALATLAAWTGSVQSQAYPAKRSA